MKNNEVVKAGIDALREGKVILYPTDTIWGIGCDAADVDAIERIYQIKRRPTTKSFIVLVDSVAMLERYVKEIPDVCYDLIDYAERPLTIIYDTPFNLPQELFADDGSLGIRVTNDPICQQLIRGLRRPIVSTSANTSGQPSPDSFSAIESAVTENVDFILESRIHETMTHPSSIIKIDANQRVEVIR